MQTIDTWLVHHEIAREKAAHPVHRLKGEGDGYDFIEGELLLTDILAKASARQTAKATVAYDRITGLSGDLAVPVAKQLSSKLIRELDKLDPIMRETWDAPTEKAVAEVIGDMADVGARRTGAFKRFQNLPTRASIEEGMVGAAKYYSNNYFNRIVLPSMVGQINKQLEAGGEFSPEFFHSVRERMSARLKSVPYWRLVGNQAASRAYHYGIMRAGALDGYQSYSIRAVLDDRTTAICKNLNGRTFWLHDGLLEMEALARTDPSRVPENFPWYTIEDVEGKTDAQLAKERGVMPPFHANCRTTVVLNR